MKILKNLPLSIKNVRILLIALLIICIVYPAYHYLISKKKSSGNSLQPLISRTLETSQIPISLDYIADLKSQNIIGDGGSIGVYKSGILLMDRLGNFYRITGGKSQPLDLHTPNNIEQFKQDFPDKKIHGGVIKSTSFLLDEPSQSLFAAHNKYVGKDSVELCISKITFNSATLEVSKNAKWQSIFCTEPIESQTEATHGSGGKLLKRDSSLFLSVGFPPDENYAQSRTTTLDELSKSAPQDLKCSRGKIIQVNLANNSSKVISLGHRNPQGLVFDAQGNLLNTEHGPQGGDEINLIKAGSNYGYPINVLGTRYGTYDFSWPAADTSKVIKNMVLPIFAFVPSIAISPIIQLSDFHPKFNGDLLVGSLKAQSLYRLKYINQRILYSEPIWIGHRIRDMVEYGNSIYLLTDDPYLIELKVDQDKLNSNSTGNDLYFTSKVIQEKCMVCHSFGTTSPASMAPSLAKVFNRKIASDNYQNYSSALKSSDITWTEENLTSFLKAPGTFIPGTTMPNPNLSKKEISEAVDILKGN